MSSGSQNVLITDANLCTTSTSIVLSEPTPLQTNIVTTDYNGYDISCYGYSDGGIDLTVTGSVAGYTYLWNTTDITEDLNNLSAATYSVDITDANSCTTSTSIVLSEPTSLQTTIVSTTEYSGYEVS